MNCRLCRTQIEEVEMRERLSEDARAHLESCAKCQIFYEETAALKNLIGELATVSTPSDFNLRLRARLDASRGAKVSPSWFGERLKGLWVNGYAFAPSAFSIALAACFTLAVGAALLLNNARQKTVSTETAAKKIESPKAIDAMEKATQVSKNLSVADSQTASAAVKTNARVERRNASLNAKTHNVVNTTAPRVVSERKVDTIASTALMTSTSANSSNSVSPVAPHKVNPSANFSATVAPRIVQPTPTATDLQNVNSSAAESVNAPHTSKGGEKQNDKTVRVALGLEGAPLQNSNGAKAKPGSFLISHIAPESIAARGGLQAGDIIETINGHPASESLSTPLMAKGQIDAPRTLSLRVVRNGKSFELTLTFSAK